MYDEPEMESVMPKQLWKIITDEELNLYEKMAKLMKALKIKHRVSMREPYGGIVNHVYLPKDGKLFFLDVFVDSDDTCHVEICERTSGKRYTTPQKPASEEDEQS